jgi:hypothetical protein
VLNAQRLNLLWLYDLYRLLLVLLRCGLLCIGILWVASTLHCSLVLLGKLEIVVNLAEKKWKNWIEVFFTWYTVNSANCV